MDDYVWIQLYVGKEKSGGAFPIEVASLSKSIIYALAKAVYQAKDMSLGHCNAADLFVYKAGTEFPSKDEYNLDPLDNVPKDTASKNSLRVVAPAKTIQQAGQPQTPQTKQSGQIPPSTGKDLPIVLLPRKAPSSEEGKREGLWRASKDESCSMQCSSAYACARLLEIFEAVYNEEIEDKFTQASEYFVAMRELLAPNTLGDTFGSNERFLTGAMANALNSVLTDGFTVLHMGCLGIGCTHSDLSACRITNRWPRTLMVGEGKWSVRADKLRNETRGQIFNELMRHRLIDQRKVYSPILLLAFDSSMLEIDLAFPSKKGTKLELDMVVEFSEQLDKNEEAFWTVRLLRTSIEGGSGSRNLPFVLCFLTKALKELDEWPQEGRLHYKTPIPLKGEEDIDSAEYHGDNVTIITSKAGSRHVYKEFCYHLREFDGNPVLAPLVYIKNKDQRQPPPPKLLEALGDPYSAWTVIQGPLGISVLRYDFIEGSQDTPSVDGWLMILKQVKKIHEAGYVHGDLLPRNVLFNENKGYVIDFDLSREKGKKYVAGYNYIDFQHIRHKDAKEGMPMLEVHDVHALLQMSKIFFDLGQHADKIVEMDEVTIEQLTNMFLNGDRIVSKR